MTIPGEAQPIEQCPNCGELLPIRVLRSPAGYYIGQCCDHDGPMTRLSEYYTYRETAEDYLATGDYGR
jgi:hypothetical protein